MKPVLTFLILLLLSSQYAFSQIGVNIGLPERGGTYINLAKENYRPLSVLTSTSKVFEGIMCDQLLGFISSSLSTDLSAYRKSYSCSNVLVKCVENWRKVLENNHHVGCILIDLSKAFDCLPHGLLIAKLNAYGSTSKQVCPRDLSWVLFCLIFL